MIAIFQNGFLYVSKNCSVQGHRQLGSTPQQAIDNNPAAKHLHSHAGKPYTEILDCCIDAVTHEPFPKRAKQLVSEHHYC